MVTWRADALSGSKPETIRVLRLSQVGIAQNFCESLLACCQARVDHHSLGPGELYFVYQRSIDVSLSRAR